MLHSFGTNEECDVIEPVPGTSALSQALDSIEDSKMLSLTALGAVGVLLCWILTNVLAIFVENAYVMIE